MKDELNVPKPNIRTVFEHYGLYVVPGHGAWVKAECPLPEHQDTNPSASLNEDECKWRCHCCSESGDAIDVVMRRDGVGFLAARSIAEGFLDGESDEVRSERGSSSLLPRSAGNRQAGRHFVPAWRRL